MKNPDKSTWTVIVLFVAGLVAMASSSIYTNITDRQTERKFCAIVELVSNYYRENPKAVRVNPMLVKVAAEYEQLRRDLNCAP